MKFTARFLSLAGAAAVAVLASTAAQAGVSGTVSGTYLHGDSGLGSLWGGDGAVAVDTGWSNIGLEGNVGYTSADHAGHSWDFGGSAVWTGMDTRIAASVVHYSNVGFQETHYGLGALVAPSPDFDIYAQGGGITGTLDGSYFGGGINWYVCPTVGLGGSIHYGSASGIHETDYTGKAEWLISQDFPLAINAGYQRTEISFGGHSNIWFVGLTFYANDNGAASLPDRKHTGTLNDIGVWHPISYNF